MIMVNDKLFKINTTRRRTAIIRAISRYLKGVNIKYKHYELVIDVL